MNTFAVGACGAVSYTHLDVYKRQELTQNTVSDRMAEIQQSGTDQRAAVRLEQLRAEALGTAPAATGQLESGVTDAKELVDETPDASGTNGSAMK